MPRGYEIKFIVGSCLSFLAEALSNTSNFYTDQFYLLMGP